MALNQTDIDRLFLGKLRAFDREERSRHIVYVMRDSRNNISIPALTLSRGTGDVGDKNVRGLASSFGMSRGGFEIGAKCRIRPECFWLCLSASLLANGIAQRARDPNVYNSDWISAIARSATTILTGVSYPPPREKWNPHELSEIERAYARLIGFEKVPEIQSVVRIWREKSGA